MENKSPRWIARTVTFNRPLPEPAPRMDTGTAVCLGLAIGSALALCISLFFAA